MSTILYDQIVFGPIHSRRLGISLGMNLLPTDGKVCSFDCLYCECGFNKDRKTNHRMPTREEVREALRERLTRMQAEGIAPDVITFAGNGEPTLHPDFESIIADTIATRDAFFPKAKIAVLSNATQLHKESVVRALSRVEDNILKFDSILDSRIQQLDRPNQPGFCFARLLEQLKQFKGNLIIQTMFLKGEFEGQSVNNMTEEEVAGWLQALREIAPKQVMIYTIDRETPAQGLLKATHEELDGIAERARKAGFDVTVSY
ncbi:radical SAM protein [Parabacteroides distasonis]|nr:radical SAM protein [Parabacteroides distasonis]